jgi:hypothetical protein
MDIFNIFGSKKDEGLSPLQAGIVAALKEMNKLPVLVPAVFTARPELAQSLLQEMEDLCLCAAAALREARAAMRDDPIKAITPVAVSKEGA